MIDAFTNFALVGAAASAVAWGIAVAKLRVENVKCRIAEFHSKFSIHTAAFIFFATIATLSAQKQGGGTNDPPRGGNVELKMENVELRNIPHLTEHEQIRHSTFSILNSQFPFRLESVTTNYAYSYAMPTNGVRYERWWKRGAYEDVFRLDFGGMTFPLADELLSSVWVYSWGMAGAHLGNASNRLVATGVPMSAVPGLSQFWSSDATNGAKLLTWETFFLNRDTNTLVSAQLEIFSNGDFIARSNEVMRVYRRVNPDDWDDDGDPNGTDPDPYVAGEPTFGPQQQLPQGANSNAYCWVDLVVSGAASIVTFSGEGASNLPDPSFIALPGETNRVMLLIGKEYRVASRMPICCVGRSDYAIEVSQDSATSLSVVWPVTIEPVAMRSGASFSMSVTPDFLGGGFTWTNCCCSISSSGNSFTYSCDESCHCSGCAALGCYTYEGFTLPASGGSCGCGGMSGPGGDRIEEEDDPAPHAAAASASFSKSAVIFEDGYWNTPTNWVGRHSTTTELHCVAYGGPNGGHVRFEITGETKLEHVSGHLLPVEQDISPGKKLDFTITYKGQLPSTSAEDIVVTTTFTENEEGSTPEVSTDDLTAVRITMQTHMTAPQNTDRHRHTYGVCEKVALLHEPSSVGLNWSCSRGSAAFSTSVGDGVRSYSCPVTSQISDNLCAEYGDTSYTPQISIVEPTGFECRNEVWHEDKHRPAGEVGGVEMRMRLYVLPQHVSFCEIYIVEIPCNTGSHSGFYEREDQMEDWYHTVAQGAGEWGQPSISGYWMTDNAGSMAVLTNWCAGVKIWDIPIGWNSQIASPVAKEINPNFYKQRFEIFANGSFRIDKHANWILRTIDDHIFLNGVQKK